jgi:uncharacterized protein (TIGR02145 family)
MNKLLFCLTFTFTFEFINAQNLKEIKIGNQIWMKENLNVGNFRNGDPILLVKSNKEWIKASEEGKPAACYYKNKKANGTKYSKLYNWYAVNDPRGLAPEGWKIPSDNDWKQLSEFLGGVDQAAGKMKTTTGWYNNSLSTNESGFSALPGGDRSYDGRFDQMGSYGKWWSSTENNAQEASFIHIYDYNNSLYQNNYIKGNGFSVRCLKK